MVTITSFISRLMAWLRVSAGGRGADADAAGRCALGFLLVGRSLADALVRDGCCEPADAVGAVVSGMVWGVVARSNQAAR